MPTANIIELWCLKPATGTDFGHLTPQIKAMLSGMERMPVDPTAQTITSTVAAVPGLMQALDEVSADPDQLYVTLNENSGLASSVWPADGRETAEMHKGAVAHPNLSLPFDFSVGLSLWDRDSFLNDDDLLGAVRITTEDAGGTVAQMAMSEVEGSFYYVTYNVVA